MARYSWFSLGSLIGCYSESGFEGFRSLISTSSERRTHWMIVPRSGTHWIVIESCHTIVHLCLLALLLKIGSC